MKQSKTNPINTENIETKEMKESKSLKEKIITKYKSFSLIKRFLILYSLSFLIISFFVFFEFIINKKTLIWSHDGYTQHLKSAVFISKWLRGTVNNLIHHHTLAPANYSFGLGYGGDVLTTLNFYGFGDIIYLPTMFMTERIAVYYHNFVIYIRYYLAGVSFFATFNYIYPITSNKKTYRIFQPLCGALLYSFCGYAFFAGLRHPQFLIPMIVFPILIVGMEKLLREQKPNLFVITIFLSSMSNFILFFMMAVLVVVYFIWREFETYGIKNMNQILRDLFKTAVFSIIGLMLAGGIIVPVIAMLINDSRTTNSLSNYIFYSAKFVRNFLATFISMDKNENWTFLGYGAAGAVSTLFLLANRKENKKLFRAVIIVTILLFSPLFGYIVYGTSYSGNRWVWAYSLLISYITAVFLPKLFTLKSEEYKRLVAAAIVYFAICIILDYSLSIESSFHMIIIFICISISGVFLSGTIKNAKKIIPYLVITVTLFSVLGNAYFYTSYRWKNISSEGADFEAFTKDGAFWNTDADALSDYYSSNSFYRFSGNNVETNSSLLPGISTTGYFWSVSNKYINEYRAILGVGDTRNRVFYHWGLDERPQLMSLASVYFYELKSGKAPYGFNNALDNQELSTFHFYENDYKLPLGYGYLNAISRDSIKDLDSAEIESLMMNAAIVEDNETDLSNITHNDLGYYNIEAVQNIEYDIPETPDNISLSDDKIITTGKNTILTLDLKIEENEENETNVDEDVDNENESIYSEYLEINGLTFKGCSEYSLYKRSDEKYDPKGLYGKDQWKELTPKTRRNIIKNHIYYIEPDNTTIKFVFNYTDDSKVTRMLEIHPKSSPWGTPNKNFIINAGVPEDKTLKSVQIIFPNIGTYSYDSIKILHQPLNDFPEKISDLNYYAISNVDLHKNSISQTTSKITATYQAPNDSLLCLSIPYSKGWSIYVDGEKQELIRTNIAYMGTYIKAGGHSIELRYETPGLKIGLIITIIGFIFLILMQVQKNLANEKELSNEE